MVNKRLALGMADEAPGANEESSLSPSGSSEWWPSFGDSYDEGKQEGALPDTPSPAPQPGPSLSRAADVTEAAQLEEQHAINARLLTQQ